MAIVFSNTNSSGPFRLRNSGTVANPRFQDKHVAMTADGHSETDLVFVTRKPMARWELVLALLTGQVHVAHLNGGVGKVEVQYTEPKVADPVFVSGHECVCA